MLPSLITELSTDESESSDSDEHEYTEPPIEEHEDEEEEDSDSHEYIVPHGQHNEDSDNDDHDDGKINLNVVFSLP